MPARDRQFHFEDTHGFVVPPPQVAGAQAWPTPNAGLDFKVDVLATRSGLALAGAKKTAAALPQTGLTLHGLDGVLTAAEAGSLQLEGTSLVVLNVCRSGAGALVESEGLVSLRTALVYAGARDVVSALWDLDEHYANEFSKRFYEAVFRSGDPAAALAEVQSAELRRLASRNVPNPLYESVKLASPWIVTHGGRP